MTIKLRLTGSETDLHQFVNWLHLAGLSPDGGHVVYNDGNPSTGSGGAGSYRCYLHLELPAYSEQVEITTHPGDGGQHAPALALRGQAGVVAVRLDKVGELCEEMARMAAEFAEELVG